MTTPAEDPRGGEACACGHDDDLHDEHGCTVDASPVSRAYVRCHEVPAAGRGDTDSGGEVPRELVAREVAKAFGNDWDSCTEPMRALYLADADRALFGGPAARPAGDHVDPAEIVRQRSLGWPDTHPEDHCHTCGRPNPVWFADTAEWQTATESTGDGGGILCPSCFCALWEKKTGKTAIIWRLSIDPRSRDARRALGGTTT